VNKRTFIKTLAAAVGGPLFAPLTAWMENQKLTNWAGNLTYATNRLREAESACAS
jgi:hypothetical protein